MSRHLHLVTSADRERFWAAVRRTSTCWIWTDEVNNHGYGRFCIWRGNERKRILAHRLSFWISNGDLPRLLRHTCDNPPCVNPQHLIPGTQAENLRDAAERGRTDHSGLHAHHARRGARLRQRIADGWKRCPRCGQVKALDAFGIHRGKADGRQAFCRPCRASYSAERRVA